MSNALRLARILAVLAISTTTVRPASADPVSSAAPSASRAPAEPGPIVVYVVVPLCSNEQINCGSPIAGRSAGLEHNVYWGAVFGARRFLERKNSGWERVAVTKGEGVFLERAIFRRFVPGAPWGREAPVEELVVLQAIHGDAIDQAVDHFFEVSTEGGTVSFQDGGAARQVPIQVAGYAGHNRLMDGKKLPSAKRAERSPVPAFVLACLSEPYFAKELEGAGSHPLVTTSSLMAPEGYLIDAIARGIGERLGPKELRARAVAAYAKWQNLTPREAGSVFAKR